MSNTTSSQSNGLRWVLITGMAIAAFVGAYGFAAAKSQSARNGYVQTASAPVAQGGAYGATQGGTGSTGAGTSYGSGASGSGTGSPATGGLTGAGGCCGGGSATSADGVTGATAEGAATLAGGVQKISVDVSTGTYNPNVIKLKAGVPAEVTFANGTGCTGQVQSQALNFSADMTNGPATVKLPALKAGTYSFYCGMQMVFGKIVVE
jgi:plastocyanin